MNKTFTFATLLLSVTYLYDHSLEKIDRHSVFLSISQNLMVKFKIIVYSVLSFYFILLFVH